jgi:hypothetical protein
MRRKRDLPVKICVFQSFGELPSSTLLRPGSPDGQTAFLSVA